MKEIYLIHKHSLDHNDFDGKYEYELTVNEFERWIKKASILIDKPFYFKMNSKKYDINAQHLINYEE